MVVFRPFVSEVIIAKVKSSDEEGIRRASRLYSRSNGDLPPAPQFQSTFSTTSTSQPLTSHNPPHCKLTRSYLFNPLDKPHPSDPNERAHFWIPDSELTSTSELLDTPVSDRMYIDQGEVVRVRVESDEFCDDEPGPPKVTEGVQMKRELKRPPYIVCVSGV